MTAAPAACVSELFLLSPSSDDSSLLALLLDVSPAALSCLASAPGLGLQSMLEQVGLPPPSLVQPPMLRVVQPPVFLSLK